MSRVNGSVKAICLVQAIAFVLVSGAGAQVAPPTPVERGTLSADAFATGAPSSVAGALPRDLWRGADPSDIADLLRDAPATPASPGVGEALRRTLLATGDTPPGATPELGGLKLRALARSGFAEEARTIASLSNAPQSEPYAAEALATADLLANATEDACGRSQRLRAGRDTPFWLKLRVFCYAAAKETDAAGLTLDLLREQGELTPTDVALLTPLAFGGALASPPSPESALHLAVLRRFEAPVYLTPDAAVDGGVLRAVAEDAKIEPATRLAAAMRAAAAGIFSTADLGAVFQSLPLADADLANATGVAAARPNDPMTDVLLHRSIQLMQAPEFLRDKAGLISLALNIADSFPRLVTASRLYEADLKALQGALVPSAEAATFARARLIAGDANGAAQWLLSMLGGGKAQGLPAPEARQFAELVAQLDMLDPAVAKSVAEAGGISIERPVAPDARQSSLAADPAKLARILDAAFSAASGGSAGLSALAGIAASAAAHSDDPIASVVFERSLQSAGLADLARRTMLERFVAGRFAPAPAAPTATATRERGRTPRLKPPLKR